MIKSVKETYEGRQADPTDCLLFWTYLICRVHSGRRDRFNLIRIDNTSERMERLGCELTLGHCRTIVKRHEPTYPKGRKIQLVR